MKVLFILEDTYGNHDMQGLGILSSIAKIKGWEASLIIRSRHHNSDIIKRIKSFDPDVVAYSLATGEHRNILNLHREIKKHVSCHFIFGGPHPTFFPEFIKEDDVDTICIGEGEVAFSEYLDRVGKNEDFPNIRNLYVKRGNEVIKNPLNSLVEDLDSIPFPDRKVFMEEVPDLYKYYVFIAASRGCPHSCTYCSNLLFKELYKNKGRLMRSRSVNSVIEEIKSLEFTPQIVIFQDDNFLHKPKYWIEEFIETWGTKVGLPFNICTSADLIKEPVIKALKEVGLRSVVYALETGDDEVNKKLLNRRVKVSSVIEAGKILGKYKVFTTLQSITLLPVSDPFSLDLKTLRINQEIKPTLAVSTPLTPYPGTEIAKYAVENGYLMYERIDDIEKINKVTTVLDFKKKASMKKSLLLHYFFDLLVHFPFLTPVYKFYFLIPDRFYPLFYNFYELIFAYKRYFLYIGVELNRKNILYLFKSYLQYKLSR